MTGSDVPRRKFLRRLFELSGGVESRMILFGQVTVGLGLTDGEAAEVIRELERDRLIEVSYIMKTIPSYVRITWAGMQQAAADPADC